MAENISDTAQHAADQAFHAAQGAASEFRDRMTESNAFEGARDFMDRGREALSNAADDLRGMVRREPWLALAAAFIAGYIGAQIIKRLP